jgi:hypothetical protein
MTFRVRAQPFINQMRRGRLPASSCRHHMVDNRSTTPTTPDPAFDAGSLHK